MPFGRAIAKATAALTLGDYRSSVVRRAFVLYCLLAPAFGAGFLIYYFASALLPADSFGILYVSFAVANVLYSGSLVLNIFLTKHFVAVAKAHGEAAAFAALGRIERLVALWGGLGSAVLFLLLWAAADRIGLHSKVILLLVVLDAYSSYLVDLRRALLQGLLRTVQLGCYTLVWMILRLAFCVLGILAVGTVWAALTGDVAAALVALALYLPGDARAARAARAVSAPLPPLAALLPLTLGYGLLIAIFNLDVILGYFLLAVDDLGVYSASSVFPKTILVATTPLLQMLFALMADGPSPERDHRAVVGKSAAVVLALSAAAAGAVWVLSGWLCGGSFGLKLCSTAALEILLLSVVPLGLLRVLVLLQFARGRDWLALWLIVPTLAYVGAAAGLGRDIATVATTFASYTALCLVLFAGLCAAAGRPRATRARSPA